MNCDHLQRLVAENRVFLRQLEALLARISAVEYRRCVDERHSLGRHLRHIIDHYQALFVALHGHDNPVLDYEKRQRDPVLEDDPGAAHQALTAIQGHLDQLTREPLPASLLMAYPCNAGPGTALADPQDEPLAITTTVERELIFLASHTVHHMALMGRLATHLDLSLPAAFGVHPSTLRHWSRHAIETAENS